MCTTCGCNHGDARIDGQAMPPGHEPHAHPHAHPHAPHHAGGPPAHPSDHAGTSRLVQIEQDILAKNNAYAQVNRQRFEALGILALNLVSSPGAGKTTLLVRTIRDLAHTLPCSVIEGDQQTDQDAARIRETGTPAVQINTGKGCHLDGHGIGHAAEALDPQPGSILFIENVGNLVCPASFDLGEAHKVLILSVTEGEDKPLKYPDMFHAADLLILNKVDLLPYVDFDVDRVMANARRIHPDLHMIRLSARTGEGMEAWLAWLRQRLTQVQARRLASSGA